VLAGPDPDETALTVNLPAPRFTGLKDLRIAVWAEEHGQATDAETVTKLHKVADALELQGVTVSRTARPAFDPTEAYHIYLKLLDAAWSGRISDTVAAARIARTAALTDHDMSADDMMLRAAGVSHRTWLGLNERRFQLRRIWSAFFREWDVLLSPVISSAAIPHRQDGNTWERRITIDGREMAYNDMLFWPGLAACCHLPATSAPVGIGGNGLPLGVQIVGPLFADRSTIAAAALLEHAGFGFKPPPGW
jgi:amidase